MRVIPAKQMKISRKIFIIGSFFFVMLLLMTPGRPSIVPAIAYQKPYFKNIFDFNLSGNSPLGENMTSLMVWGYWQTLLAALLGRLFAVLLSLAGLAIAWTGRSAGHFWITRISEALMTIPSLLLALSLGYLIGEGFQVMILVIAVSEWAYNQKWMLGRLSEYKRYTYVEASLSMGAGRTHIFRKHFWPLAVRDLSFLFFIYFPGSLLTVTALEFLGVSSGSGVAGLGSIIALNKDLIFLYPHVIIPPVVLVVITVYIAVVIKNEVLRPLQEYTGSSGMAA